MFSILYVYSLIGNSQLTKMIQILQELHLHLLKNSPSRILFTPPFVLPIRLLFANLFHLALKLRLFSFVLFQIYILKLNLGL